MSLLHRQRFNRQQKRQRAISRKRQSAKRLCLQDLETRIALDSTGLAGNECLPDLDLSGIAAQTIRAGETWTLNLLADGATATDENADGTATNDAFHFQLDPDVGVDVPTGVVLVDADGNTVETNADGMMTWTPTSDQIGTHTIMIIMMDAGSPVLADSEKLTVVVTDPATNTAAPEVDLNGSADGTDFATTFTSGGSAISIVDSAGLSITDADGSTVQSASIVLTNPADGTAEALAISGNGSGLTISDYDAATGTLTITGDASLDTYQTVLRTLTYVNTAATPTVGDRTVEIIVNDGLASTPVTSTITVELDTSGGGDDNVAPSFDAVADQTVMFGESVNLTVTASDTNDNDTLTFQIDVDDSPTGATLTQSDNNTAVISWTPTEGDGPGPHTVRVIVTDSGSPALSDAEEFTVAVQFPSVVDLNGPADGVDFAASFVPADGSVGVVSADATLTDVDNTTTSLTATLANTLDGDSESLTADASGTAVNVEFTSGVLTLSGAASAAELQQVLRTISYSNAAVTPTAGDRTITILPLDSGLSPTPAVSTVTVPSVVTNNAPSITAIDDQTVTVGTAVTVDVIANDVDNDALTFSLDSTSPSDATITATSATTAQIQWTPSAAGDFDFIAVVTDDGSPTGSASASFTLTVENAAAAAPVIDLNGTIDGTSLSTTFTEDGGPIDLGSSAVISDADSTQIVSATVTITNLADGDAEQLSVNVGEATIGSTYINGLLTLVGPADISVYETILNTLTYENSSVDPTPTPRIVEFQVSDGDNFSNIATATVDIVAVEGVPNISGPSEASGEATAPITIDVSATDPEGDAIAFTLGSAPTGATIADNGDGTATVSWTPDESGSYTISVVATDTDNGVDSTFDISVSVAQFNAAPTVDLNGAGDGNDATATFTENGGPITLASDLTLEDDGEVISSATITISNLFDGDAESLAVTPTSNDFTTNFANGVLTIAGPSTIAGFESVLRTLTYNNTSQDPDTAERQILVSVNDSGKNSNVAAVTVAMSAVNNPPTIVQPDFIFIEVGTPLTINVEASDPDSSAITLRLDDLTSPADAQFVDNGDGTGTISWTPTSAGDFAFVVAAQDNDDSMPLESNIAIGVNVHPTNTPPVVDLNGPADGNDSTAAFVEDGGVRSIVTTDVVVSDAELSDIWSGTITITNLLDGDDELIEVVTRHTDVTATYDAGVITLEGRGTLEHYMNILESLSYVNNSDTPSTEDRIIEIVLSDGVANSATAMIQLTVTATNDAPVAVDIADQQAILGETLEVTLTVDDPDATTLTYIIDSTELTGAELIEADGVQVFTWTPATDFAPGDYTASIMVTDDGAPALTDLIQFNVAVGARPTLDLNGPADGTGYGGTWLFGGSGVPILMANEFIIQDSDNLTSAFIAIVDPLDGANEVLSADESGTNVTVSYDSDTNVLMLSGEDTVENYRAVMATLTYDNIADAPSFAPRTIQLSVSDGVLESDPAIATILVQSQADGSDTIATAESLGIANGDTQTVSRLIESGADVDLFEFSAMAGETLYFNVDNATLDLNLRMFDATGTEILISTLPVGDGSQMAYTTITADGDYYLGVSSTDMTDYDPNDNAQRTGTMIGAYDLVLSRFTTGTGDDTIPLASPRAVDPDADIVDELDSDSDVDMFAIDVTSDQLIEVMVDDADDDIRIQIFDALGRDISIESTDQDFASAMLGVDGTVYVAIASAELSAIQPFNPEGRTNGTETDYEIEILLSVPEPTAATDAAITDLFDHDSVAP